MRTGSVWMLCCIGVAGEALAGNKQPLRGKIAGVHPQWGSRQKDRDNLDEGIKHVQGCRPEMELNISVDCCNWCRHASNASGPARLKSRSKILQR